MKSIRYWLSFGCICACLPPVFAGGGDWSGTWATQWRNGGAVVYLQQEDAEVRGHYPLFDGTLEGTVQGRQLQGTWHQANGREGGFVFAMADDGATFMGRFDSGEWWTGERVSRADEPRTSETNYASPREVLRSFLLTAGAGVGGDVSQLRPAVGCLMFPELDPNTPAPDPIQSVRLMYELLDQLTFRIWDVPGEDWAARTESESTVIRLAQQGTDEEVSLEFMRVEDGWRILALTQEVLRDRVEALRAARAARGRVNSEEAWRASARSTMRTFLELVGADSAPAEARLVATMDLSHLGADPHQQEARLLSEYLKRVIDRVGFVLFQEIPDDPWQKEAYIHFRHPAGTIVLAPTGLTENGVPVWQFTGETMQAVRDLYLAVEDMPVAGFVEPLPLRPWTYFWMRQHFRAAAPWLLWPLGSVEIWQWAALLLSVVICWLAAALTSKILLIGGLRFRTLNALASRTCDARRYKQPLRVAWTGFFLNAVLGAIGLPDRTSLILGRLSLSVGIFALIWLMVRILHAVSGLNAKNLESAERNHRGVLVSLTLGLIRVSVILAGVLWLADIWAVPYSSMLTGLGIGGIAVALATQNTLQNVIAGFTLFADRPLSVGDFCKYGGNLGTVERIGLRSVRIRTLDRSVVSIPTAAFAEMQLENLAVRDRFLFRATLGLRYETTGDQLRFLLAEIRKMLVGHPKVLPDPARVRFDGFGDYSLNIDLFTYICAVDWNEYLAVREDINFRLMKLVEAAGTGFAFPSQTTYFARDGGLDGEKGTEAERQVDRWRKTNKLPSPDYTDEDLERMEDSLDYPPEGSVLGPVAGE